jgi:hypothetical protein
MPAPAIPRPDIPVLRPAILVAALTLGLAAAPGQQPNWVRQFPETATGATAWVADVKVASGFVYAAGTVSLPTSTDAFVRKYDGAGNLLWERQFGTPDSDDVTAIGIEGSLVFVAGVTNGAFPGFNDVTPFMHDPFVATFDVDGNPIGTMQAPRVSSSWNGNPNVGFVDATGVYGTDVVDGVDFDTDVLVFKYDHLGNLVWTAMLMTPLSESTGSAWPRSLSVSPDGVFVVGATSGAFPNQSLTGYQDAFVARLDAGGNVLWVRQTGATERVSWSSGVAPGADAVYASRMTVSFEGDSLLELVKMDLSGGVSWVRELSAVDLDVLFSAVAADGSGVCVGGATVGEVGGPNAGSSDVFVRRYDAAGNEIWTVQLGSSQADEPYAVALADGAAYVGGVARAALPDQTVPGGAFLARLGQQAVVDSDQDGLSDADELVRGTNPANPDTDADGLVDGAEVALAAGAGCPSPLDDDSDGDSLLDGVEVNSIGSSPCLVDTDGDMLPDHIDPQPVVAGPLNASLETMLLTFADLTVALPPSLFEGATNIGRIAKRTMLAARFREAACKANVGNLPCVLALLREIERKIDPARPACVMLPSPQQADMLAAVELLIDILDADVDRCRRGHRHHHSHFHHHHHGPNGHGNGHHGLHVLWQHRGSCGQPH